MKNTTTLLVPVDSSTESEVALPIALKLARSLTAEIVLLHVTELPESPAHEAEAREAGEKRLKRVLEELPDAARLRVQPSGDPVEGILRAIEDEQPEIVVMATRGNTGIAGLLEGSTASGIIAASKAPVLLVPLPND